MAGDLPIPQAMNWRTAHVANPPEVEIEEIAAKVPENCFYVRFGKYSNLLWATRLLEDQGEELQRLVTLRGFRSRANTKIQSQLAIQELPFADLIGDRLIDDVAFIGRDLFLGDGPAVGVILKSKGQLLDSGLAAVRRDAVANLKAQGATQETVRIEGRDVSLISTPDNRLRSFHVIDGPWNLITNSESIAASFLRLDDGERSLADLPAFRHLRTEMPFDKKDTVFTYLSTKFMSSLLEPAYLTELLRRVRARQEIHFLEVAMQAAQAESAALQGAGEDPLEVNTDEDVVAQLKSRRLLPANFSVRPDKSRVIWRQGRAVDSLRGGAGTFLPIPDIEVQSVTREESETYQRFVVRHAGGWTSLDPLVARIRREKTEDDSQRERLLVDFRVTPLQADNKFILLGLLGSPQRQRIAVAEGSLITLEGIINGRLLNQENAHLQLSVLDGEPVPAIYGTRLADLFELAKSLPLRLLVTPGDVAFQRSWWRPATGAVDSEYWLGPFDLIGRRLDDYAAIAFCRPQLDDLPPNLQRETTDEKAQIWLQIADLQHSALADCVTGIAAVRAMRGSLQNVQRFHQWSSLLGCDLATAPQLVERLVGLEPVCPLDGSYELQAADTQAAFWDSTAWSEGSLAVAKLPDYEPAILRWWHGLDASCHVNCQGLQIVADVTVDFQNDEMASMTRLPFFGGKLSLPKSITPK